MGVHGLWDLLAPVGRRVSVETLTGKKLAIDASIWMVQFIKAMRDERGEMVRNAHLIGFFRRICKLLFLKTKPVFVFDGGTPALKRRTVIARRRQRENAQSKIRKTAEKLLINHLKTMRLRELAIDLENQRKNEKSNAKGKKILSDVESNLGRINAVSTSDNREKLDEMLAASIAAQTHESFSNSASKSATASVLEEGGGEFEDIILSVVDGNVDPVVFAALPPSMQHQLLARHHDGKGKKVLSDDLGQIDMEGVSSGKSNVESMSYDHEKLDEMLAASIAAEEDGSLSYNAYASASAASVPTEEEDGDEDEEMILPAMTGNVDPAVLASLPPSMQLDLLTQMRERLMAENRQKYQKVKKAPEKFSELQIQAYLKTVAFRRDIDQVQKAAAGRGVAGVQTSRIASEANREFIFSSSFSGDKQVLTSSRIEGKGDKQQKTTSEHPFPSSINNDASIHKSNAATTDKSTSVSKFSPAESRKGFTDDLETYLDERGRVRVSKRRAMGIRMTSDLQRNLDLMKEIENEIPNGNKITYGDSVLNLKKTDSSNLISSEKSFFAETSHDNNNESESSVKRNQQSLSKNGFFVEISFDENNNCEDDDLFAHLAAGKPVIIPGDNSPRAQNSNSISDSDWEEGTTERKGNSLSDDANAGINPPLDLKEGGHSDESEMEWEEGTSGAPRSSSSFPAESEKTVSNMEEEANLQEAIRRSLLDACVKDPKNVLSEHEKSKIFEENAGDGIWLDDNEKKIVDQSMLVKNVSQQNELLGKYLDGLEKVENAGGVNNSEVIESLDRQLKLSEPHKHNSDVEEILISKSYEKYTGYLNDQSRQDATDDGNTLPRDAPILRSGSTMELKVVQLVQGQCFSSSDNNDENSTQDKTYSDGRSHNLDVTFGDSPCTILVDDKNNDWGTQISVLGTDKKNENEVDTKHGCTAEPSSRAIRSSEPSVPLTDSAGNASIYDTVIEHKFTDERTSYAHLNDSKINIGKSAISENENALAEATKKALEEEILVLDQEYINLGDEQKRLERNSESVSSEMFAECQELLQMFGLPYIIAPMEAEAQCAYMELANLVDGVVTDDSDVFLFGARSVYKNIFDDRKYVETYFMQDIEKELGLTREKLIRMALLLGSDYTEGISGIGIVNAIEVLNAFPQEDGLVKFREWIESPDPTILGKFDVHTRASSSKRRSKNGGNDINYAKKNVECASEFDESISESDEDKHSVEHSQSMKLFMNNHRNVSKNWHIPTSFPSEAVISAYVYPQVDKSTEPFLWGKPDLFVLRKFCWDKFGWGSDKSNELLVPVLKEYEKRETQLRLEAFYTFNEKFAKIRSKRIKKAVKGITENQSSSLMDNAGQEASESRKKKINNNLEKGNNEQQRASMDVEESVVGAQKNVEKSIPSRSRKRKELRKSVCAEIDNPETRRNAGDGRNADDGRNANRVSGGSKIGQRVGRGRGRGRGRFCVERSEASSSDGNGGDDSQECRTKKLEGPQRVRRSTRSRKPVNYSAHDPENDGVGEIIGDKECSDKGEAAQDWVHDVSRDSADCSRKKLHTGDNPSINEDYIETGGGFCIDDGEIGQPSVSPLNDRFLEAEISKGYLKIGGGFCEDETETGGEQLAAHNQVVCGESEVDCDVGLGDSNPDSKEAITCRVDNIGTYSFDTEPNEVHNASGVDPVQSDADGDSRRALTGMTFLRRKRRS